MKPSAFSYRRPETLDEALSGLADLAPDAKVLAGGQSLLPLLSMRLAAPKVLIDINRLTGLDRIEAGPDGVRVGALARHSAVLAHSGVGQAQPLIPAALRMVAHPTIRNRGTTLGSIVHADPAAEMPTVLALLDGSVTAASSGGRREIAAVDFFAGPLESTLRPDELALEASFPALPELTGTAFDEISRRHGDYALCGVAAVVRLDADLRIDSVRTGSLSMAGTPLLLDLTDAVAGRTFDGDLSAAGELARELVDPEADIHASADYRRQLAAVLTERVVRQAARRAAGVDSAPVAAQPAGEEPR